MARRYGLGTGLPDIAPQANEDQFRAFNPVYQAINGLAKSISDAIGLTVIDNDELQQSGPFVEYSGNLGKRMNFIAGEAISPARLIWLDTTASESKMWHASALSGVNRAAYGFCIETNVVPAGQRGRVILFDGLLSGLSGVTPGTIYWLGAAGQFTPTMPSAPGVTQQKVGLGLTSNSIMINISL